MKCKLLELGKGHRAIRFEAVLQTCGGSLLVDPRLQGEGQFAVGGNVGEGLVYSLGKAHGQMSVTWMAIPSRGKMRVSSCDFTNMVSCKVFDEFYLPSLQAEVRHMTHNVFHLDGKGMLRHLDRILAIPEIQAIQWVHGVGDDAPIMQWLPVIKKIQAAGKGVLVDLQLHELEPFIAATDPAGLYLCIAAPGSLQPDILKRLEKW